MKEPRILFLDLETTGFDPDEDRVLEVGAILVTPDLVEIGRWRQILPPPPLEEMTQVVDMHRASGLLDELPPPEPREIYDEVRTIVERSLLEWLILEHEIPQHALEIAGYSIHFDRAFLRVHLPRVSPWLSHRMIDVSTIRQLDRRWREQPETETSPVTHRVWPDCEHALSELRRYRAELWRPT